MTDKKKNFLTEELGPTIRFGKHSSYYKKGNKIIITTKRDAEEMPENVAVDKYSKKMIYEDNKGVVMITYELFDPKKSFAVPKYKPDPDWGF